MILSTMTLAAVALTSPARTYLDNFVDTLHNAEGLSVNYTVQEVGGVSTNYTVNLAKPNKARIETDAKIVVADGTNVTVYMKDKKAFYKKAQTPGELKSLFNDVSLTVWLPFFDETAMSKQLASAKNGTDVNRGGKKLKTVNAMADAEGSLKINFYLDASNVPAQVEFISKTASSSSTRILSAKKVELTAGSADLYAFAAPAGAQEIKEADLIANKWYGSLDEAMDLAKSSGRIIMVDFMASWCGPCHMMDDQVFKSADFKEKAKDFVLVKIDVDEQKAVAQRYQISAMPTVKFLRADGSVLHQFVGYGGPAQVFGEMAKALSMK